MAWLEFVPCQEDCLLALDKALKPAAAQMNIEGGNIGLCGNGQLDCSTGGDYVEIYDGKNAHSPLLGHVTGDITDDRTQVTLHAKTLHHTLEKRSRNGLATSI